jgi:protein-disulfide isomerase
MFAIERRTLLLGASALALAGTSATLAACNNSHGGTAISEDDVVLGQANAPVTLIEYASAVCPHCAHFHAEVFDQLKEHYIDTGKVRYVFREFPTEPAAIAVAGFQLARCGGATPEQYFARLGEIFRQRLSGALFASGTNEGVRQKFFEIGAASGLSQDQVTQCISDQAGAERIRRIVEAGNRDFHIEGTPTLVLNGRVLNDPSALTFAGLSRLIDAELAS